MERPMNTLVPQVRYYNDIGASSKYHEQVSPRTIPLFIVPARLTVNSAHSNNAAARTPLTAKSLAASMKMPVM
jgi:hypothetical protein